MDNKEASEKSSSQNMDNQEASETIDALSLTASSSNPSISASQMSLEEKFKIVRSIGEECIQEDELMNLLAKKPQPICYDGFEPSGRMHIAQGVLKALNVNKLTSAGCKVKIWIADWFAQLNNKMGGDLKKIEVVGQYLIEIWKAVGMNLEGDQVEFLWSSKEINSRAHEYWPLVMDIARRNKLPRILRCCQIMGRSEQDELTAAQIFYPCMQCADIFFLKADICQLGMDQRKVNVLAREYCDDIKRKNKPIILSHHMLPGLQEGQEKMSKSDPSSSIYMEDEEAEVNVKIKKAFCPPKVVEKNPCLEYVKYIVLPWFNEFKIERSAENGGDRTYTKFEELAADYESGSLHPADLKPALSKYNRILLILSKSSLPNRLDCVREIVDEMERTGIRGNISTVNLLIGTFGDGQGNGVNELTRCLGLVQKWDLKLNCYSYKCLLQAYIRLCNPDKALEVYQQMRRRGYRLDIFAYNMLLDALARDQKVDQVHKVFEDMKKWHCEPDEYTYTILIRMTGKLGKPGESLSFFLEMLSNGISPNLIAYNTMIEALAKGHMVDKSIFVFSKMVENSCRPNEFTYSIILNVLAAEGQLGRLDEVVEISKRYMNKSIYAYLVRTLSKIGHASEAHRLFCNMWSFHDRGDRDAYLSMLESLCNSKKVTEAIDLLNKMNEKGVQADSFMYNTVFSALGKLKQIPHLHDLYEKMKRDGPTPDIFTYNILISSFGRAGEVGEALKIFEELENSNCKPDIVSYNSLINCLGKNGDIDEAHMKFIEMQEKGLNPDVVTYSTLIECFGKTEKVEMARRLFDEMLAAGCYPNIVTYNILLDCLERSGRTSEAVSLYAKLKEQGLAADSITYTILERLQSGSHRTSRVRRKNPITGWVVSPLRWHVNKD